MQALDIPSSEKKTKVFHIDLLELGKKLGYPFTSGLCRGFSMMVAQAFFAKDIQTFISRLNLIAQYKTKNDEFSSLLHDLKNLQEKVQSKTPLMQSERYLHALQIPAFYDSLSLYQHTDKYKEWFEGRLLCLKKTLPINLQNYKSHYIFIDNTRVVYIQRDGITIEEVPIDNLDHFKKHIEEINLKKQDKIHLSHQQIHTIFTLNGGHVPGKSFLHQEDIGMLFTYVKSQILENQTIETAHDMCSVFNKNRLKKYLNALAEQLKKEETKKSVIFSSGNHIVYVSLSDDKNTWDYVDINDFERHEDSEYIRNLRTEKLIKSLFISLFSKNRRIIIYTNILCCQEVNEETQNAYLTLYKKFPVQQKESNQCNLSGISVLLIACQYGLYNMAQLLLRNGASINQPNQNKSTPLYMTCQNGHYATAELLLQNGASINQATQNEGTPLLITCQYGYYDITKLLLKNGGAINHANKTGITPLFRACYNGHYDIAELLLENKASIHQANANGETPLHIVCEKGYDALIQLLLENGADILQKDTQNKTALDIATQHKHASAIKILLSYANKIKLDSSSIMSNETKEQLINTGQWKPLNSKKDTTWDHHNKCRILSGMFHSNPKTPRETSSLNLSYRKNHCIVID